MSLSLCFPLFQARFPARMVNHHTDLLCFVFLLHPGVPLPWLCWSHVQTRGTHKDLPMDYVHFCSGVSSSRFARPQCWWGRHSQWGKTCHVSRRMGTSETNKLFVVGCLFHDSFVTQLPFSSSWFFFGSCWTALTYFPLHTSLRIAALGAAAVGQIPSSLFLISGISSEEMALQRVTGCSWGSGITLQLFSRPGSTSAPNLLAHHRNKGNNIKDIVIQLIGVIIKKIRTISTSQVVRSPAAEDLVRPCCVLRMFCHTYKIWSFPNEVDPKCLELPGGSLGLSLPFLVWLSRASVMLWSQCSTAVFAAHLELIDMAASPFPSWLPRSKSSRRESNLASCKTLGVQWGSGTPEQTRDAAAGWNQSRRRREMKQRWGCCVMRHWSCPVGTEVHTHTQTPWAAPSIPDTTRCPWSHELSAVPKMVSVGGLPALGVTAVLGCCKEHMFVAVAGPGLSASTRPVLKNTPDLANVSFGLMGVLEYCFSFGAIPPWAAAIKRAHSKAELQVCVCGGNIARAKQAEENLCFVFLKNPDAIAFYLNGNSDYSTNQPLLYQGLPVIIAQTKVCLSGVCCRGWGSLQWVAALTPSQSQAPGHRKQWCIPLTVLTGEYSCWVS